MSNKLSYLALLAVALCAQSVDAADAGHANTVAGAERPEWLLPEGTAPGPVMIVRFGGEPARLDGGLRALEVHALFPMPQTLPGVGLTRHLSGRYEFDCKGQVRVHHLLAQRMDGSRQAIDVTTPWGPVGPEDEERPCRGGSGALPGLVTLVEAETVALIRAREGDPFGPKPDPIAAAPELKEVCSLVRENDRAMRIFRTVALPLGATSPLPALEAAAAKRERTGNSLRTKCLPAGRLADEEHATLADVISRRAHEDGLQFSDEPPLRP